jgi:gluconate kinase
VILILFGVAGCGKNYVGRVIEEELGFYFYDLDLVLTDHMKDAISDHRKISDCIRDEYIEVAISKIVELREIYRELIVAQALFKNKHQRMILGLFPDAQFIWVQAEPEVINARLARRAGHLARKYFADIINSGFEPPTIPHSVLTNNAGREEVTRQLKRMGLSSEHN